MEQLQFVLFYPDILPKIQGEEGPFEKKLGANFDFNF